MHHATRRAAQPVTWLQVRSLGDIEYLVKESEVLTGRAGRYFVISSADWLLYRVHWHPAGLQVDRLDGLGQVLDSQHLPPWALEGHSLAEALATGQLFTASITCGHPGRA